MALLYTPGPWPSKTEQLKIWKNIQLNRTFDFRFGVWHLDLLYNMFCNGVHLVCESKVGSLPMIIESVSAPVWENFTRSVAQLGMPLPLPCWADPWDIAIVLRMQPLCWISPAMPADALLRTSTTAILHDINIMARFLRPKTFLFVIFDFLLPQLGSQLESRNSLVSHFLAEFCKRRNTKASSAGLNTSMASCTI